LGDRKKGFSAVAFVGLAQKIYSLKLIDKSNVLKCKGIPYSSLRKCNFDTYKDTLFTRKIKRLKFRSLRSYKQQIYQLLQN